MPANMVNHYRTKWRSIREVDKTRDMTNWKPYRTAAQKRTARTMAQQIDGRWVSPAPVSYHTPDARLAHEKAERVVERTAA